MSASQNLRRGMVLRHEGHLFVLLDFQTAQSGKMRPTVHLKLRDIRSGNTSDKTLDALGKVEEVASELRTLQYLYAAGRARVFMDTASFEQSTVPEDLLAGGGDFLVEGETYRFLAVDDQLVSLQLPPAVVMTITDTARGEHAGGMSNVLKEARLASGLTIRVPLFLNPGDKVRVKTDTREYVGKEH